MQDHILTALHEIIGRDNVTSENGPLVVTPSTVEEVSKILSLANSQKIPVFTGKTAVDPAVKATGIILSLTRMNRILEIDTANLVATAEAGVPIAELNEQVEKFGLCYPPDPGTIAGVTLGDTVSENTGGLKSLKYGAVKHYVMGLEIVLADGRILKTGGKNVKDVAGYDLTKLLTGSKGTLGIITKVTVKLMPSPETRKCIVASFTDINEAGKVISEMITAKVIPSALEIMDNVAIKAVEATSPLGLPSSAKAMLLIELDGIAKAVEKDAQKVIDLLSSCVTSECKISQNDEDIIRFWAARRTALPALTGLKPAFLTEDITVPRNRVVKMLGLIEEIAGKHGIAIGTLGHAGDGNLLPTLLYDSHDASETKAAQQARDALFCAACELGGAVNSDDKLLQTQLGRAGMIAVHAIKQTLDPNCILNPGKVVGEC